MNKKEKHNSKKRKFSIALVLTIIFLLVNHMKAFSQDSLMNYLEIAAKNNPAVQQKFYEYQAALQKVPQVGGLPDPELNIGLFLSPMELVGGKQVAEFQLMQMFPWFGVLKNSKDEMSLMAKAKYESFRDAKLQVFYNVQRTWYELHNNAQNIRIYERNLEILKTLERLALVKYKSVATGTQSSSTRDMSANSTSPAPSPGGSGMTGMSGNSGNVQASTQPTTSMGGNSMGSSGSSGLAELYRLQIETGDLENSIALLKSQFNTLQTQFNLLMNRPAKTLLHISDSMNIESFKLPDLSDSAFAGNPMLTMLEYEQQSLQARQKMVSRMGYPMVGLGINYSLINKNEMASSEMNGKDMIMPMVTVTLPIYRKKYKAMKTEAELMRTSTEQSYKATANSLYSEYSDAVQLFLDAERRIDLYKNQSNLAQKSLDIMVKSFSVNGTGLTDILRVRQQLLDYEVRQARAVADFNNSVALLKRLLAQNDIH